jgi:outer membrane protein OmpA-like peptidoglycan-associated protein
VRRPPVQPLDDDNAGLQAVGDLMAGLLLLFMLLAMVFAMSLSRTEQERVVEIDALTRAAADQAHLRAGIVDHLSSAGVPVTITKEPGVVRLGEGAIRFAPGQHSSDDPVTLAALERLADALAGTLPDYACTGASDGCPEAPVAALESVLIEGHSDTVDRLDDCDNHCLSARRASWTRAQLLARRPVLGSLRSRAGQPLFGVNGYGPDRTVTGKTAAECAADGSACREDRRIEVRLRMEAPHHLLPEQP